MWSQDDTNKRYATVTELVDERDLKSLDSNVVWVQVPSVAPWVTKLALQHSLIGEISSRLIEDVPCCVMWI